MKCKDFIDNEDVFLKIFKQLNRNYLIGKGLLKYFEKDRTALQNNTFLFVSQIVLASTPRFQEFSIYLLSSALIKSWKYVEPIEKKSWLQSVTGNSLVDSLRHRIYVILEVIKTPNRKFFDFLRMSSFNIRLKEGRLQDSGDIRFLGQKIFIEVAVLNVNGFEQQLASLIDAVFAHSDNISIGYVLVDVLIELTIRAHQLLLNCKLKLFENLITGVSSLPAEVSTVIIRSLLPVLNLRAELRAFLLETMKLEICTPKTIPSAFSPLQIILLLFKSLSDQSALRKGTQMSQSFATFSTQVLNQIVYKGLVDICKKNAVFVVQVMDLLVRETESLPPLTILNYVDAKTPGIINLPISHLVKELSDLIRLSVHAEARASMAIFQWLLTL
uniref:Uncharacterized protein n=1 Tax=Ditylenchus dipsaci TaxID=166011 RepID=A0A915DW57_9BILA